MLNPFPELLSYGQLSPLILRLVIGIIIFDLGLLKLKKERRNWIGSFEALGLRPADLFVTLAAIIEIIGGALLIIGLYTQIAALVFAALFGFELFIEYRSKEILKRDIVFYLLVTAIALSLLLTGAGAFARDIPL